MHLIKQYSACTEFCSGNASCRTSHPCTVNCVSVQEGEATVGEGGGGWGWGGGVECAITKGWRGSDHECSGGTVRSGSDHKFSGGNGYRWRGGGGGGGGAVTNAAILDLCHTLYNSERDVILWISVQIVCLTCVGKFKLLIWPNNISCLCCVHKE